MRVDVLGAVRLVDDTAGAIQLSQSAARLLALLVVAEGASIPGYQITDGSSLASLSEVLGPRLQRTDSGYRLVLDDHDIIDAELFTEQCAKSATAAPVDRRDLLTDALGLWNGNALQDFAEEPWAESTTTRLDALRVVATEDLAETLIEIGDARQSVALLEPHVLAHPHRERPVGLLMRALAADGRSQEATAQFERFGRDVRAMGIEPTSELRELASDLLGGLDPPRQAPVSVSVSLPSGTVTFMFTDIEGSTQRWQDDDHAMSDALAAHDHTIRSVVDRHGGIVFKHTGDGVCAVFTSAPAAVAAAVAAQGLLELPVRVGLHTGEAELRDRDYFGPTLNLTARVMDAGHGGQVLVSSSTAGLVRDHDLVDLGEHHMKGLDTAERIFQVGRKEFPPLRTPRQAAGNLPVDLSSFVGRSHDVKALVDELADHRLVTLIGVGGTGKTRLAVETGIAVSASFPDGCWMVELAAVTVDAAVPFAFAAGLGITAPPNSDVIDGLVARLRHKQLLVVVDNCEHVLVTAADAVERIVAGCPTVAVLATSREPLMVRGERLVPVPSLPPDDAERLFLERARAEAPDLVIDADQSRAVAELCQRLDGLPLALELAASRVRALTPVELVANLEERFRLLVGGRRSRMERHQTMRGTLDWSYDLCTDLERVAFDRLSVFPAGFDLLAARAVAGGDGLSDLDVVDVVPQLVDRSLLHRATATDGTTRYRMLETMRAYGREHLQHQGASDSTRARHAGYMADTIAALSLRTLGPEEDQVARRLYEYLPDALVALDWFIDHREWERALCLTSAGHYLAEREASEMIARLTDAARAVGVSPELQDELDRSDPRLRTTESRQAANARARRTLRAQLPIPAYRVSFPPHGDFNDGGLAIGEVDEFITSLDRWISAPAVNRYYAEWFSIRALAHNGHLSYVDSLLSRFTDFVAGLHSGRASLGVAELHGVVARTRLDWPGAAQWYGQVDAARDGPLRTWFDLAVAWHLLTARALCDEPFELTGAQLRDPWQCLLDEHLEVLQWHGATATALALHRIGRRDLADRLVAWGVGHDETDSMRMFADTLAAGGLSMGVGDPHTDLDRLLQPLFAFADELDSASADGVG
jgi:predicted ATPase/class 3 adenylate cyclase